MVSARLGSSFCPIPSQLARKRFLAHSVDDYFSGVREVDDPQIAAAPDGSGSHTKTGPVLFFATLYAEVVDLTPRRKKGK
jgi:hypothetical protein